MRALFQAALLLMASLGPYLWNKDSAPLGKQPLLLVQFTFPDGSQLFASTHNLNTAEGGTPYQGQQYIARIDKQDIDAIQSRSQQGIDRISDVTLHLHNADQLLYNNFETDPAKGFKGTLVKLVLVLMDIDPSGAGYVFTNDNPAPVKFSGICDAPDATNGEYLTVRATTSHSLARVQFPVIHVQQRCVNPFPPDKASRQAGALDMSSWYWNCGYSPDILGTDPEVGGAVARGNLGSPNQTDPQGNPITDASGIYIACNYTRQDCIVRGMFGKDSANRVTGRFTAIEWAPVSSYYRAKQYTSGNNISVFMERNDSVYQRSFPMVYGAQWVKKPVIANILGDGNATRFECCICVGNIGPFAVNQVVVNGVMVPPLVATTLAASASDALFRWNFLDGGTINSKFTGGRSGVACGDTPYNGQGDPYGGIATIEIVVYNDLAQSNGVPDVRILLNNGPKIKVPNTANPADQATWPYLNSNSPAWVLMDLLIWGNYSYTELDIQTFLDADAVCSQQVTYLNLAGQSTQHNRYICEFALEDYKGGNEVIQAVLRGFNAQLVPNSDSGLMQLFIRQTLADQQPNPIPGSNYAQPIQSVHADGTLAVGYVAYLIDESVIQGDGAGKPKLRGPYSQPSAQTPNRVTFGFQDHDNVYQDDSISMVDAEDVARAGGYQQGGQQIPQALAVIGIQNFDQGTRIANVYLAENLRGNENQDTRGTRWWDLNELTSRVSHLRVGQIVLMQYQQLGLTPLNQLESPPGNFIPGILLRVEAIKPTTNYERVTLTLRWHEDVWYTDLYGQEAAPLASNPAQFQPPRPPYPWKPFGESPVAGDSMWDSTEASFGVAQAYQTAGDGTQIARLTVRGFLPVNQFGAAQPPLMGIQGSTSPSGGTIPGGIRLYLAITVQDANGQWSPLSKFCSVDIPSGTNTNIASTPLLYWPTVPTNWTLYAGVDEQRLTSQVTGSGPVTQATMTSLSVGASSPPDALANSLILRIKPLAHGGVWNDQVVSVSSNGDGTGNIVFTKRSTTNQFVGCDLSLVARAQSLAGQYIPIEDFQVLDNNGFSFHVTPDPTFPTFLLPNQTNLNAVVAGDVFELRLNGTTVTSTSIGDPNLVNASNPQGLSTPGNDERGNIVRIIKGTGRGQTRTITAFTKTSVTVDHAWDMLPDSTSRWIVEEATWQEQPPTKILASQLSGINPATVGPVDVSAYYGRTLLVQGLVQDSQGNRSLERFSPLREIYLWGNTQNRYTFTPRVLLPGVQVSGTDVLATRYTVKNPGGVLLASIGFSAKIPASTQTYIVDIQRSSDGGATFQSLFPAGVLPTFAVNTSPATYTPATWAIQTLNLGDLVRVDVVQADGTIAGVEMTLNGYLQ